MCEEFAETVVSLAVYACTRARARLQNSPYRSVRVWLTEYGDLDDHDRSAANEWKSFSLTAGRRALTAINQGASAALFWDAYDNYHEHYPRLTFYGMVHNTDHIHGPKKRYFAASRLEVAVPDGFNWSLYQTTRELNCVKTGSPAFHNGILELQLADEAVFTLLGAKP